MKSLHITPFLLSLFFFTLFCFPVHAQQAIIDSLKQVLAQTETGEKRVKTLIYLSYELNNADPDESLRLGKEALTLAQKLNYTKGLQSSYIRLAGVYATQGKLKEALDMLDIGEPIALLEKDTTQLMKFLRLRSAYNSMSGDLDEALLVSLKHLQLAKLKDNKEEQANALLILGYMNADYGKQDYVKALEYYTQAVELSEETNDEELLAFSLLNISSVYYSLGDVKNAIKSAERTLKISQRLNLKRNLMGIYAIMGSAYYDEGEMESAINYIRQAVELSIEINEVDQQCKWTLQLAQYLNIQGAHEDALFYLSKVDSLMKSLDRIIYFQPYYEELAIAQKAKGDYENAFKNYALSMSWKDSSYQEIKVKEFEEIQTKYETEKKEQENQFLAEQNNLLAVRNQLYTYIGIGLVFIITILSWLFYQLRKQKQTITGQNVKLEALNDTKNRLFAIIAHDMRNAVHSFRDVTDSISYFIQKKQPERIQKIAGAVEKSIDQLGGLLDNLLEWALVQRGDMPYQPEYLNLLDCISEILGNYEGIAARKEVQLEMDIAASIQIFADKKALQTTLRNLVSNALKFTHSGDKVKISAAAEKQNIQIEVQDTGIGMDFQQTASLFQPSKNKSRKGTAGEQGSGLGLVLVKELVNLNKGSISVQATQGEGTVFTLLMPKLAF